LPTCLLHISLACRKEETHSGKKPGVVSLSYAFRRDGSDGGLCLRRSLARLDGDDVASRMVANEVLQLVQANTDEVVQLAEDRELGAGEDVLAIPDAHEERREVGTVCPDAPSSVLLDFASSEEKVGSVELGVAVGPEVAADEARTILGGVDASDKRVAEEKKVSDVMPVGYALPTVPQPFRSTGGLLHWCTSKGDGRESPAGILNRWNYTFEFYYMQGNFAAWLMANKKEARSEPLKIYSYPTERWLLVCPSASLPFLVS